MFKISKKINDEKVRDGIYNVQNIVYKVSTNTLLKADTAIQHIKRNKKIYKNMVLYIAICLSPELIRVSHLLIVEFIRALASVPQESLLNELFRFIQQVSLTFIMCVICKDIILKAFKTAINNIKK